MKTIKLNKKETQKFENDGSITIKRNGYTYFILKDGDTYEITLHSQLHIVEFAKDGE